jgi:hypothetical protein
LGASSRRRFTDYGNTVQPDVPDAGHDPDHGPNTATYVQMGNQLDTLEPGKLADIVLLDGNPLEGYWNWLKTTVVIKGGVVVVDKRPKPRSTGRPASGGVASRPLPAQHDEIAHSLAFLQIDLTDPEFHAHARANSRGFHAGIRALVKEAVSAGELARCDPSRLARALQATLNGSLLDWAIHRKGSMASWIRQDLRAVLDGYRPSSAR